MSPNYSQEMNKLIFISSSLEMKDQLAIDTRPHFFSFASQKYILTF